MGNHNGSKLDYKQEEPEKILDRAKAESQFSDKLYALMLEYQERLYSHGNKTWSKPLSESERVGDLNLPLSRLYNLIWSATLDLNSNARSKKKQQQMEVEA